MPRQRFDGDGPGPRDTVSPVPVAPRSRPWSEALDPPVEWLVRANRHALVTRMVATTVHDVSNALQVMSGAAEMLGLDPGPEQVARRSGAIVQQAMGATGVLQRLTAFARDPERPAERVRLLDLAARVLEMRQYALRKGRIATEVRGDDAVATAPARDLLQVLLNLVVNAETALADRPAPALALVVAAAEGGASITVEDTGPGFAPGMAAWFHWPPPPPGESGALGVGLLVSRALVERAGGTLTLGAGAAGGAAVTVGLRG